MNGKRVVLRALAALVVATTAVLAGAGPASAGTLDVPCGHVAALRAAIETANGRAGDDTISLAASCTYTITDVYAPFEGLPLFTKKTIILEGNGATIRRADGDLRFRLVNVAASGRLVIRDLTLRNGFAADVVGGGISVSGDLFVTGSSISGNKNSGVLVRVGAQASFVDTSISGNDQSNFFGAGINNHGNLYLEDVLLSGNKIPAILGFASEGGALFNDSTGSAIVRRSSVSGNRARVGAGISNHGDLLVLSSTISGNDTWTSSSFNGPGSAINSSGTVEVVNSTIKSNSAGEPGGAVHLRGGTASFLHTTIAFNSTASTTSEATGGIYNRDEGATVVVQNSIVANNGRRNCRGAITDGGYVLTFGVTSGCPDSFLVGDPKLSIHTSPLQPGVGSAALDRIPASGAGCLATDQRGLPRPGGALCDIGAYENQAPTSPGSISASSSPNRGVFDLTWGEAIDPDGDPLSYRLERRASNETDWTTVGTTPMDSPQFAFTTDTPEQEGRLRYRVHASDGILSGPAPGLSGEVVVDRTPPVPPTPDADRAPEYVDLGTGARWFADTVTVSFVPGTDPPLADGSAGTGIASTTGPQTFATTGEHVATGTSTDAAGNESAEATATVFVDADPPTVEFTDCPAEVILDALHSIGWTAADVGSGLAGPSSGTVALDTSSIGTNTAMSPAAFDNVGHSALASCTYRVIWDFSGFRVPLRPFPELATLGAGARMRVSFGLGGDQGLEVFEPGYPVSAPVDCSAPGTLDAGEPTTASGPVSFSPATGLYTYDWLTSTEWKGTCRQLVVKLADGTFHRANVNFR